MTPSVVLVTGVSRFPGARLAAALAREPGVRRVIGIDTTPPPATDVPLPTPVEFVRADIRAPIVASVIADAAVDTVVHTSLRADSGPLGGRSLAKEMNVIGTLQLLGACQRSASVRRLVVCSTSAVYGSSHRDPAVFVELDTEPDSPPRSGYARDALEVERYVRAFGRRRPDVAITVLRWANVIGPRVDTPLARYFATPVVPTVLGYDPRVQFLHEDDAVEVLRLATLRDRPRTDPTGAGPTLEGSGSDRQQWTVNVGGAGVLMLSQAIRRAGRVPLPLPYHLARALGALARRVGAVDVLPERTGFVTFDGVVDTTRLRQEFGYQPRFTTVEAFDDFVRGQLSAGLVDPAVVSRAERGLRDLLTAPERRHG